MKEGDNVEVKNVEVSRPRLKKLFIKNFRSIGNEGVEIDLGQLHQGPYYIKAVTDRGAATTTVVKF